MTAARQKLRNGDSSTGHHNVPASDSNELRFNSLVSLVLLLAPTLIDYQTVLLMVFGGCCSNAWAYEQLLTTSPRIGSALTFFQMLFITTHTLPSFLQFHKSSWFPTLKPRQVPLHQWMLQVFLFATSSLLLNWAAAYKVPLTILIIFRSAGLGVSMLFGFLFLKKRYTIIQILCVAGISFGVILATLSRPAPALPPDSSALAAESKEDTRKYLIGLSMMIVSSMMTGVLGLLQERTYKAYGPCWKEGVFYTHFLSLPIFIFLYKDVKQGIISLSSSGSDPFATPLLILAGNLISQLICVSGVNRLNTQVSALSTNLILTTRKALSLCLSVWWFGNGWNLQFGLGAAIVFTGSVIFSVVSRKPKPKVS